MKKSFFFLTIAVLWNLSLSADHHTAGSLEESPFNTGTRLMFLGDLGKVDLTAEVLGSYRGDDPFRLSLTTGGYYRIHKNLKAGVFHTLQQGVLHDEDWEVSDGEWSWADISGRYEQVLTADLTPRFLLPGIPGRNWVFALKNRYGYNFYNEQQTYLLQPGLTWFLMKNRSPLISANGSYGFYFPLNFSESILYKQGPWVSIIYHMNPTLKLELRGSYLRTNWTVRKPDGTEWEKISVETDSWEVLLGLIWTPFPG